MAGGYFIGAGENGVRLSSQDGVKWSPPTTGEGSGADKKGNQGVAGAFWALASKPGQIAVAVGPYGGAGWIRSHTEDGVNWSDIELLDGDDAGRLLDVCYGGDQFAAVGSEVPNYITCYYTTSKNGLEWKNVQSLHRKRDDKNAGGLIRVEYGNDTYVGIGRAGKLAWSADGQKWSFSDKKQTLDQSLIEICYGNGVFVGVGLHGLRMTSVDGREWSHIEKGQEGEHIGSIIVANGIFVGMAPGATYFSEDGREWKRIANNRAGAGAVKIAYGDGVFVGAQYRGQLLTSRDALTWTETDKIDQDILAIDYFAGS